MSEPPRLTGELVDERLRQLIAAGPPAMSGRPSPAADPYLVAAALRSTFEPEDLPVQGELAAERIRPLLEHSTVVEDGAGGLTWMLRSDTRREVLEALGDRYTILDACRAYPAPGDALQDALRAQLEGRVRSLFTQSVPELAQTLQVSEWLSGVEAKPVDPEAVRRQLDRELLLEPLRYLVGDHFAGRTHELQELRNYVGVLGTGSLVGTVRRRGRDMLGFFTEPPLVVSGVGGIGKSTLLAKFILEHATDEEPRLPFAYLDFDRLDVQAESPITLLLEAARQLAVQSEHGGARWERKRREWSSGGPAGPARSSSSSAS